ncbi:membrane protein [Lentzea sp. NBRC 105346]|uniref:anti-sigma factor family protein n=1 Tax=Lentzea sp. NBRC 105346 TaxID=3032205 RepID=UPI0024A02194|nr:zf-HC2 domain-containing protein [Lentzea sp. NBRC 105346]GLZ36006.1 membrane protein [Lentzea sp. NBRC 105346]
MTAGAHDAVTLGCYALGVLDVHERRGVEQHLSWCAPCRAQVADFGRVRSVLDSIPREALIEEIQPSGEMPSELVLQRALRQIRSEGATRGIPAQRASPATEEEEVAPPPGQHRRGRAPTYLAAAAVVAAVAFGAGAVVVGLNSGPSETTTAQPPGNVGTTGSSRELASTDSKTGVKIDGDVTYMDNWVRVAAAVSGLPADQKCRLIVVGKDGRREVVSSWMTKAGTWHGGGSAAVPPAEVVAVSVESEEGKVFVTAKLV